MATSSAITSTPANIEAFRSLLQRAGSGLQAVCATHMPPERLIRLGLSAASRDSKLLECTSKSLLVALMYCGQLGLEPNTPLGHAYLIPYRNKKLPGQPLEATFVLGYKGSTALAYRSGQVKDMDAAVVRQADKDGGGWKWRRGLDPVLRHTPDLDAPLDDRTNPIIAAYCVVTTKLGGKVFEVMSRGQIDLIRNRSRANSDGPWVTDYDQMAKKTVLKQTMKRVPSSTEYETAIGGDEAELSESELPAGALTGLFEALHTGSNGAGAEAVKEQLKRGGKPAPEPKDAPAGKPTREPGEDDR